MLIDKSFIKTPLSVLYLTSSLFLTSLAENKNRFTQQITYFLVVDLDERAANQKLF